METIQMDDFDVVAVPNDGVYVTDGDGNGWKVAPHCTDTDADDKLRRRYSHLLYDEVLADDDDNE